MLMTYAYGYITKGHFAVTRKLLLRTYCNQVNLRMAYQYQKIMCFDVWRKHEILSDGIHIDAVENEQISQICYIPVCKEWQKDHCNLLGLPYIHGNMEHHTTHVMVSVNHCPSSTTRIVPDGNCFFRALSFSLTGSQDYHQEVRLLVTT